MADYEKQKLSARERQIARIEQLKKQLQQEEAKLKANTRKERNSQLVALGIFFEQALLDVPQDEFEAVWESARENLKGHTRERVLVAMERLARQRKKTVEEEKIDTRVNE